MKRSRVGWRGLVGIFALSGVGVLLLAPQAAVAQVCTAALDVDVHYCRDTSPVPCDPLNFVEGMPVAFTVEVTNGSEFQPPNPPADPPGGQLQVGDTIKVYYACSTSICDAGDELPGYFDYVSVASTEPGVSFADDGNGYSGTITITAPVAYASGDKSSKDLVVVNLVARQPPGTGQVFARAGQPSPPANDTSDQILLLTDPGCLAGLTGGGQGSTAGLFDTPGGGPVDICSHRNKQIIKIDNGGFEVGKGRLAIRAPGCDPSLDPFTIGYDNAVGGPFNFTTVPSVPQSGRCWTYVDKAAKTTGGLARVQICPVKRDPELLCINWKGYGEIQPILQDPLMPIVISACGSTFVGPQPPDHNDAIWIPGAKKWVLPKDTWNKP